MVVPGMIPMLLAMMEHDVEVFDPSAAGLDPLHRLVEPAGPLAAGRALAAALVGEETAGVIEVIDDARLVVDDGHRGRAQAEAAGLAEALEVQRACRARRPRAVPC